MNFTALSQHQDSTLCFSVEQVKTILRTKVELQNALETNELLVNRLADTEAREAELIETLETKTKKLKRTRWIAGGASGLSALFGLIVFLK